jgi:hypothetical protein
MGIASGDEITEEELARVAGGAKERALSPQSASLN